MARGRGDPAAIVNPMRLKPACTLCRNPARFVRNPPGRRRSFGDLGLPVAPQPGEYVPKGCANPSLPRQLPRFPQSGWCKLLLTVSSVSEAARRFNGRRTAGVQVAEEVMWPFKYKLAIEANRQYLRVTATRLWIRSHAAPNLPSTRVERRSPIATRTY